MSRLATVGRAAARAALGLFVVGQLLFLLADNLLKVGDGARAALRTAPPAGWRAAERVPQRWAELTGQSQDWQLFAPDVAAVIPFPAVELRWDDDRLPQTGATPSGVLPPQLLLSDNEPADPCRYLRFGHFRLRRYETTLDVSPAPSEGPFDPRGQAWAAAVAGAVRAEADGMYVYLRWRLAAFRRQRPDLPPPTQVVLLVRLYRVPAPPGPAPWRWEYLGQHRVARWLPGERTPPGYLPVEAYDPTADRFERLGRWGP